ncbi:3-dehydroquinate synthase-domain-containing protein, partial [Phaeosphaeriaceae sp. PMI808]
MDIVGFAASMLQGGIPYVRIPTTPLGMIDAGVGVKVGVNFGGKKNFIGRYYAPVACFNDHESFLCTLPVRELACGLVEAIKMAIAKTPHILTLIEHLHRKGGLEHNTNTDITKELIHVSIRSMVEELQSNFYEEDLHRQADFGHEFGNIVEALARHELPHGECVAIGMAISSSLAHWKGTLARHDLQRILNCILDIRLP